MTRRGSLVWPMVLLTGFSIGAITDWWLVSRRADPAAARVSEDRVTAGPTAAPGRASAAPDAARTEHPAAPSEDDSRPAAERSLGTTGTLADLPAVRELPSVIEELRGKALRVPVDEADVAAWKGGFEEDRRGREHEAVDILAPRGTPVHAVDDGVVAKLFTSKAGGITLYQYDPTRRFTYYYAHLDRYADPIREGDAIWRGQVIAYVGSTGNAPPDTPHLHFAIFQLSEGEGWWQGRPIDPYLAYHRE